MSIFDKLKKNIETTVKETAADIFANEETSGSTDDFELTKEYVCE